MKKIYKLVLITGFLIISLGAISQPPPPPPDPSGNGNNPIGAPGAPVGSGNVILLTLAFAYAGRKVYLVKQSEEEVA